MTQRIKTNYHTHTDFCDGTGTPEDFIRAAIDKHFDIIGFSAHALYPFASAWHLMPQNYAAYIDRVTRLAHDYDADIRVMLGYEADYFPPATVPDRAVYASLGAEYLIGSVHYVAPLDAASDAAGFVCIDGSAATVASGIESIFHGDGKRAVQTYFARQRDMIRAGGFDIVGHIDVVRKRNGVVHFFDEADSWYKGELEATAKAASDAGIIVEVSTGGIARGAIDDVYPSADFLRLLHRYGVPITIASDAHTPEALDYAFDRAADAARDAGYRATVYLTRATGTALKSTVLETPL